MKKLLCFVFPIFFFSSPLLSQNAYNDILKLRSVGAITSAGKIVINTSNKDIVIQILAIYMGKEYASFSDIEEYYNSFEGKDNNPFIEIEGTAQSNGINADDIYGGKQFTFFSNIGSSNITNLADGFAKFLVKRTKEELSAAFFEQFKDFITNKKYKDARILFPQTYATLQAIGDQIYNYQAYLNTLRESFEKDLDGLLSNLPKVIEDGRYNEFFLSHPDLKAISLSSLYVGNGLMNKEHPGKIIAEYNVSQLDGINNINVKASIQILKLFSESLRSKSIDHYWVPVDSLEMLIKNDAAFKIYMGLIFQKTKAEDIKLHLGTDTTTFDQVLANEANNYKQYNSFLRDFTKQASIVTTNIKNISGKESDKLTFTDYYNFYNSALDLIQKAATVNLLPGLNALKLPDDFNKYQSIARTGGNIALDINRKNYSSAVINVFTLYNYAFGGNINDIQAIIDDKNASEPNIASAEKLKSDKDILNLSKDSNVDDFKTDMLKYASFMAAVTQAQSSDDVEAAIEAVVLPTGSARIKRETIFNVSLNAYCGFFIGNEHIKGIDDSGEKANFINNYGVTAPIGISITKGKGSFFPFFGAFYSNHSWSHSLFLSVVDIGALASFRFKDDKTQTVPNIQLKDIISPGIFYSLGIPKSPISLNIGWQVGPLLRQVTVAQNNYSQSYSRFSASIVVDLPLLNFYTKSK